MPSSTPLEMPVWNQRKTPFQCRLIARAASITAGRRLWVAQKYHFFRNVDEGLEQQREAALPSAPGHGNGLDPASGAVDPGRSGVQIAYVLEEVQMAPGPLFAVVGRTVGRAAFGTGEPTALVKIEIDVQALLPGIERSARYIPRGGQPQGHLKEFQVSHAMLLSADGGPLTLRANTRTIHGETKDAKMFLNPGPALLLLTHYEQRRTQSSRLKSPTTRSGPASARYCSSLAVTLVARQNTGRARWKPIQEKHPCLDDKSPV